MQYYYLIDRYYLNAVYYLINIFYNNILSNLDSTIALTFIYNIFLTVEIIYTVYRILRNTKMISK